MSSQEQISKALSDKEELTETVFRYLSDHFGDISGAAERAGCKRADVIRLLKNNPQRAQLLEDEYLDELEANVYESARGGHVPEGFKATEALRILAIRRPEQWDAKRQKAAKGKELPAPTLPSEGSHASKLVNGFVGKHHGDKPAEPPVVRVDAAKWDV